MLIRKSRYKTISATNKYLCSNSVSGDLLVKFYIHIYKYSLEDKNPQCRELNTTILDAGILEEFYKRILNSRRRWYWSWTVRQNVIDYFKSIRFSIYLAIVFSLSISFRSSFSVEMNLFTSFSHSLETKFSGREIF